MPEIPVPGVQRAVLAGGDGQAAPASAAGGAHAYARAVVLDLEGPRTAALAVEVLIRDQRLQFDEQGPGGAFEREMQVARVGERRHEDALHDERIGDGVAPRGNPLVHGEAFDVHEASGIDRAAGELIRRQLIELPEVLDAQVDLRHHQRALDRRIEARHQEGVVAAGVGTGDGAAGIAAQTVGHQPLAADGGVPVTAGLAAQGQ